MVQTLNKFGVPMGPDGTEGRQGILQPKLKYRFRVRTVDFGPTGSQINLTQQVMTITKPNYNQELVTLDIYNSKAYVAGKHTWEPISLTVRDDITNSVSALVGYQQQKQVNHFEQTAAAAGVNYKFKMFVEVLDGGNTVVQEQWVLEGCWLTNVNYQDLDYSSSEVQTISMEIRYDNATLTQTFPQNPLLTNLGGVLTGA